MDITIPASIAEATKTLGGIDALLRAKGWERAAIVYAFTYEGEGHRYGGSLADEKSSASGRLSLSDFAALGIAGLSSRDTVRKYRTLWAEHGTPDIKPGDKVTLPELDFPPDSENLGSRMPKDVEAAVEKLVENHGAEKVATAVARSPKVAKAAVTAVAKTTPETITEAMDADDDVDVAVTKATWGTEKRKSWDRERERFIKETVAAKEAQPKVLGPMDALQALWGVEFLIEKIERSERNDATIEVASGAVEWLRNCAGRIEAWVNGDTLPMSDEDFEAGIRSLIKD